METLTSLFVNPAMQAPLTAGALQIRFDELHEQNPKLRRRDAALQLDVPEAALIDAQCGLRSVRLSDQFADIINELASLGYIMTLTRNGSAVHERKGCYENVSVRGPMGLVISDDRKIDLRIIVSRWATGFAVQEAIGDSFRYSLQFFDKAGISIQKIFLQGESNFSAYRAVVEKYRGENSLPASFDLSVDAENYADSAQVDKDALISEWENMTNVHQFFGMLKKHKISREQSFALVGEPLAQQFDPSQLASLLSAIAQTDLSIMCFVGNKGNIQIHTGPINNVKRVGPWLNVLDPEFNLHLLEANVANAWVIRKPNADGHVTSLELYDDAGGTIAQFFGQRVEGEPENVQWRNFAEGLLVQEAVA